MEDFLKSSLKNCQLKVDEILNRLVPQENEYPERLHQAMRYSLFAGGKRLRPFLVLLGYQAAGGKDPDLPYYIGAALEMIHTYTLIHDDLPCMDDDDLRRGKPTCHIQFDEATAVLAGDALYALAFSILARFGNLRIVQEVADMSGSQGIVGGQIIDILSETIEPDKKVLEYIHTHKTAVFISSALSCGALAAENMNDGIIDILKSYGDKIGLAFQISDDILDIEGNTEILGKPVGSDEESAKITYPKLYGLEESKKIAKDLINQAIEIVKPFDSKLLFQMLANFIIKRVY